MSTHATYRGYTFVLGFAAIVIRRGLEIVGYRNTIDEARELVDSLLAPPALK